MNRCANLRCAAPLDDETGAGVLVLDWPGVGAPVCVIVRLCGACLLRVGGSETIGGEVVSPMMGRVAPRWCIR